MDLTVSSARLVFPFTLVPSFGSVTTYISDLELDQISLTSNSASTL